MPAPTTSLEDTLRATMEEYGVSAADLGLEAESDEDAERALLSHFLYSPPQRQSLTGERNGLPLDRIQRQLQALLRMLSGHNFRVAYSDPPCTDNVNVYLPKAAPAPEEPETDLLLYRVMGLVQVGFIQTNLLRERAILSELHRDWVLRSAFHLLAARWVLRRWSDDYPGLKLDIERAPYLDKAGQMRVNVMAVPREGMPGAFLPLYDGLVVCLNWKPAGPEGDPAREAVRRVDAFATSAQGRNGTLAAPLFLAEAQKLREHFRKLRLGPPPLPWYLGIIRPEWILADLGRNVAYENEWKKGQLPLRQLLSAMAKKGVTSQPADVNPAGFGRPKLGLRDRLKAALSGPDTSQAPAYGALRDAHQQRQAQAPEQKWAPGTSADQALAEGEVLRPEENGREYDEWDYKAGTYRFSAVKVIEAESNSGSKESYDRIVQANQKQIKEIRRRFEALRVEERWLHGQRDGSEIDMNRAITAICDIHAGQQPDDRIFKRFQRQKQQVCILTMVDVSGSTQGNVLALEQEAMVLFAEGLRTLNFPHAFYAFGNTHPQECSFGRIKGFEDTYADPVYKRLANLRANGATRLGAYIRHAGWILAQRPQARRILMILSDGKPEDRGDYRGTYGIKDTAMAVQEVQRAGVHVHCISLDAREDAGTYLQEIFGRGRFLQVSDVDSLPKRLPEVFRSLVK